MLNEDRVSPGEDPCDWGSQATECGVSRAKCSVSVSATLGDRSERHALRDVGRLLVVWSLALMLRTEGRF